MRPACAQAWRRPPPCTGSWRSAKESARSPKLTTCRDSALLSKLLRGLLDPGREARDARIDAVEALLADAAELAPAGDADQRELAVGTLHEQRSAAVALTGVALRLLATRA